MSFLVIATAVLLLSSCQSKKTFKEFKMRILVFGTWVDVTLYEKDFSPYPHLQQSIEDELLEMHKKWNAWHPSQITRINKAFAQGKSIEIDPQMEHLLNLAKKLSHASEGYFEPAIGHLLNIWGFQRDDPFNMTQIPTPKQIKSIINTQPSMNQIKISQHRVSSINPEVQLDFGGFGKGFGLDLLKASLLKKGLHNFMINGGGDIVTSGLAGERPWIVGIRDPFSKKSLANLKLQPDEAIFTSGVYERTFKVNGKSYHHILNPYTGYPAKGIVSATVIGQSGAWSDAAATTMLIAGKQKAFKLARNMQVLHLMLITEDGQIYLDKGMKKRLNFNSLQPVKTHVIEMTIKP